MDSVGEMGRAREMAIPVRGIPLKRRCELLYKSERTEHGFMRYALDSAPTVRAVTGVSPLDMTGTAWLATHVTPCDRHVRDFVTRMMDISDGTCYESDIHGHVECFAYETLVPYSSVRLVFKSHELAVDMRVSCDLDRYIRVDPWSIDTKHGKTMAKITMSRYANNVDDALVRMVSSRLPIGDSLSQAGWTRPDVFVAACADISGSLMTLYRLFYARVVTELLQQVRFTVPAVTHELDIRLGSVVGYGQYADIGITLGCPYPNAIRVHWLWPIKIAPIVDSIAVPTARLQYYYLDSPVCAAVEEAVLNL